jgi:ubiquinol-cytochrome c reductase cytochrome b subunit
MGILLAIWRWIDDRLGLSKTIFPIIAHPVPRETNWWYVLGSATLAAFIFQIITGVALAFTYGPSPNSAYETLQFITHQANRGNIVRGIHYWGSSAMVVLIALHMTRTFLMGSYKFPRELNWLSGVLLFGLTLGMAFSGQLLRWNQDAFWGVVVAAAQASQTPIIGGLIAQIVLAGQTVGGATLTRFYATHVFLFPALMFGLIGLHLYLVIRHGISEPPKAGEPVDKKTYRQKYAELIHRDGIPFWPDAVWRDVAFAVFVGAFVVLLAIVVGPPELGQPADPTILQAYPRPDWYFLWLFALLALIPPEMERWFILGFPALIFAALFLPPLLGPTGERAPSRRPWAIVGVIIPAVAIVALIHIGFVAPWSPAIPAEPLPASVTQNLQGPTAHGAQVFQDRGCHGCHTIAGTGGQRGPDLSTVGSRLTRDQLTTRIATGGRNMPAYGTTIPPEDLSALVDFLSQLHGQ